MHSTFRHIALPQTTTPWLAAQATTWQMTGRCLCPFHWRPMPISLLIWVCSFIEPDLSDNNVPFDNTTPIYLINLPWKLGLGLGLDLKHFSWRIKKRSTLSSANFTDGNILLTERNHTIKITYSWSVRAEN